MAHITPLHAAEGAALLPQLIVLLQDAVASGASLGFWHPLSEQDAARYWRGILTEVDGGRRILLIAREPNRVSGTVQLELAQKQNAVHRAEVQKLMVHTAARHHGLGRATGARRPSRLEPAARLWRSSPACGKVSQFC